MTSTLALTALLMGFAGGPHCIAMCGAACGGIVRMPTASGQPRKTWAGTFMFQGGRLLGYALAGASPGSPADKAGMKAGDRIIQIQQTKIGNLEDFDLALRKFSPGDVIEVTVVREEKEVKLKVTLDKPR